MRLLIFGKDGQVGRCLLDQLKIQEIDHIGLGRDEVDITNQTKVNIIVNKYKPTVVINAAAYTLVKEAEKNTDDVSKIIITASGGPFIDKKVVDLSKVTKKEALNHPNWEMGSKITIDSATLVNKCLELIEAKYLFDRNMFRDEKLYFVEIDQVVRDNFLALQAIYAKHSTCNTAGSSDNFAYKGKFKEGDVMKLIDFVSVVNSMDRKDFIEKCSRRAINIAFVFSQMLCSGDDEAGSQASFCEFLEALARVCDMKALPTDDDILKAGVKTTGEFFKKMTEMGLLDDFCRENPCHWNGKKTRRMGELLPKFFDLIFTKLDRDGDGDFDKSDLQKWIAQGNSR